MNQNMNYSLFKLIYQYYSRVFSLNKINNCEKSRFANELAEKLEEYIIIYMKILFYALR